MGSLHCPLHVTADTRYDWGEMHYRIPRPFQLVELHYESSVVRVGSFQCPPSYPDFDRAGNITGYELVFPRSSVFIQYPGEPHVIADPNVVMLYNPGQPFQRKELSESGDISDWLAISPDVVREVIRAYDPHVLDRESRLFAFSHGPSAPEVYLLQRLVQKHVRSGQRDPLFVEETIQRILAGVVAFAYRARGIPAKPARASTARAHAELVDGVKALFAGDYQQTMGLDQLARSLHTSPFHLSRVFRRRTGQTIHQYRMQLRLRASLELVAERATGLTEIAHSLGFASHSHFSTAFGATFGLSPSALRKTPSGGQIRELSKILKD